MWNCPGSVQRLIEEGVGRVILFVARGEWNGLVRTAGISQIWETTWVAGEKRNRFIINGPCAQKAQIMLRFNFGHVFTEFVDLFGPLGRICSCEVFSKYLACILI